MPDYSRNFKNLMGGLNGIFNEDVSVNQTPDSLSIEDSITPINEDPIPKPKPTDSAEVKQKYYNQLYKKYGGYSKERADWGDYLQWRLSSRPEVSIEQVVKDAANKQGLRPELLYSSSMEEGMRRVFPWQGKPGGGSGDKDFPIDGYVNFGLDTFSDQYDDLVKKGYLPKEFKDRFKSVQQTNEKGERVNSANFKDIDDAVLAKSAMIKASADELKDFASGQKIELSPKAQEFFTLVAYNAGSENAKKMLASYNKSGFLKDDKFLEKQPSASWTGPYQNVIKRLFMADVLKKEGYFGEDAENMATNSTATTQKKQTK
jgi:hypothetical protein